MPAQLALGTMNFGRRTPEKDAARIVARAAERGVTWLDTANLYNEGEAERVVGRLLAGQRERFRVTTKVGAWKGEGLSAARVVASLDESLARLKVDFVDVYLLHVPDPKTPLAQTLDGVAQVLASGKARAWGVSNFASWQVLDLMQLARARGLDGPSHSQVLYNLLVRQLDIEYFQFTSAHPIHTSVYNPLAGGLLARPAGTAPPPGARLETNALYRRRYGAPRLVELVRAYQALAAELGVSSVTLAYAWLAQRAGVDTVLVGPATQAHLEAALEGVDFSLPPEARARIDALHLDFLGTDARYAR